MSIMSNECHAKDIKYGFIFFSAIRFCISISELLRKQKNESQFDLKRHASIVYADLNDPKNMHMWHTSHPFLFVQCMSMLTQLNREKDVNF